jgi:hypothetical protein
MIFGAGEIVGAGETVGTTVPLGQSWNAASRASIGAISSQAGSQLPCELQNILTVSALNTPARRKKSDSVVSDDTT